MKWDTLYKTIGFISPIENDVLVSDRNNSVFVLKHWSTEELGEPIGIVLKPLLKKNKAPLSLEIFYLVLWDSNNK